MQLWSITYYTLHTLLITTTNVSHWPISMYTCNLHEIVLCMPFWNMYASWCRCDRSCHCTGTAMCILEKLWHTCTVLFALSATRSVTILNTMPLLLEAMSTAAPKFAWNSLTTRRPLAKEILEYGHVLVPTHVPLGIQPVSNVETVLLLWVVWLRLTSFAT